MNPELLSTLIEGGFIPVVAPVSADRSGQAFNVNADSVAGAISGALNAERTIFLTDVPGLFRNWPDQSSLIPTITYSEATALLPTLADGMIPKVAACLRAIEMGAKSAQIVDGRSIGAVRAAIDNHSGTVFTQ